jgi:opacity protein-like surface antigen
MRKFLAVMLLTGTVFQTADAFVTDHGLYTGFLLGWGKANYTAQNQHWEPANNSSQKGFAWDVNFGYLMNRNFAAQLDFLQFKDVKIKNVYGILGADAHYQERAGSLQGKLQFPFGNGMTVYATGGAAYVLVKRSTNGVAQDNGLNLSDRRRFRPIYGIGASYEFIPNCMFNAVWQQIPAAGPVEQATMAGLGLSYNFG